MSALVIVPLASLTLTCPWVLLCEEAIESAPAHVGEAYHRREGKAIDRRSSLRHREQIHGQLHPSLFKE